jgi:UDPglucose 6-dehydrogenase
MKCSLLDKHAMSLTRPLLKITNICCIGAGYVGGPTSAVLAIEHPSIQINVADINASRIAAWNSAHLPIYEPSLSSLVLSARDGMPATSSAVARPRNLTFTTDLDNAIQEADLILIAVNTPTKLHGHGAHRALDLGYVESAARRIAAAATSDKIIVEKSTVPVRTAAAIRDILAANAQPGLHFDVLSNPEFLAEGTAVEDLLRPDRILIGCLSDSRSQEAAAQLRALYAKWIPLEKIIMMNLWSSELAKIAANALLAQRISSINALSAICEATGAEIDEVAFAVGLDKRIGPNMLRASVGFGGSCFKKDIYNLVYLAESLNLHEVAQYWRSVVDINEWQKDRFVKRIIECLYNTVLGKRIAILGFAYKKNTGDTRESAAIAIVNTLVNERAEVMIFDPRVRDEQIWMELDVGKGDADVKDMRKCVKICDDAYEACEGAHAVVIVTEWDEFRVITNDWSKVNTATDTKTPTDNTNGHKYTMENDTSSNSFHNTAERTKPNGLKTIKNTNSDSNRVDTARPPTPGPPTTSYLDWPHIATIMSKPMFVFDGRNIIDAAALESLGFRVECIGNARSGGKR